MTLSLKSDYGKLWEIKIDKFGELSAAFVNYKKVRLTPARSFIIMKAFSNEIADATGQSFTKSLREVM